MSKSLRGLRLELEMTQGELAQKIGAAVSSISQWERGEYRPRLDQIERLATALEVDIPTIVEALKESRQRRQQGREPPRGSFRKKVA